MVRSRVGMVNERAAPMKLRGRVAET